MNLFLKTLITEDIYDKDSFKKQLGSLYSYLAKNLKLKTNPSKVIIKNDLENAKKEFGLTAFYNPDDTSVTLYITGRHQTDILRSFSHEIIHHWQHENEKLQTSTTGGHGDREKTNEAEGESKDHEHYAQKDPWLRQMEKQAYLLGNMMFRDWQDENRYGKIEKTELNELTYDNPKQDSGVSVKSLKVGDIVMIASYPENLMVANIRPDEHDKYSVWVKFQLPNNPEKWAEGKFKLTDKLPRVKKA